jgi:hypothetical protein
MGHLAEEKVADTMKRNLHCSRIYSAARKGNNGDLL